MGGKRDGRLSVYRHGGTRRCRRFVSLLLAVCMLITSLGLLPGTTVSAASTPVSKHGKLSVKGTNLVDSKGKKFQLRGISTHGINWDVGKNFVNKNAFKTLRDQWGVNAIRLSLYTEGYNGYCSGGNKSELRNLVYKGVKYATELGMYVVIDWHILSDGNPNTHYKDAKSFFTTMAKKYKNYRNVIYEICNEPNGCSWSLSNKAESASLLKSGTKKTSGWKTSDLSAAGKYIKSKYLARKKKLGNSS